MSRLGKYVSGSKNYGFVQFVAKQICFFVAHLANTLRREARPIEINHAVHR
jgi:hypothetical protein